MTRGRPATSCPQPPPPFAVGSRGQSLGLPVPQHRRQRPLPEKHRSPASPAARPVTGGTRTPRPPGSRLPSPRWSGGGGGRRGLAAAAAVAAPVPAPLRAPPRARRRLLPEGRRGPERWRLPARPRRGRPGRRHRACGARAVPSRPVGRCRHRRPAAPPPPAAGRARRGGSRSPRVPKGGPGASPCPARPSLGLWVGGAARTRERRCLSCCRCGEGELRYCRWRFWRRGWGPGEMPFLTEGDRRRE